MVRVDTLKITPETLRLIAELDEFKGAWRALGTLAPDRLTALRKVATIESIGSSTRIEGSQLSDREIEQLLSRVEVKAFDTRDAQEVAGYAAVMELIFQSPDAITLTENHIQQLHRDLLQYSAKDEHHRGKYKTHANSIAAFDEAGAQVGIVFATATPFETLQRMRELVDWAREELVAGQLHPLLVAAIFLVVFLAIHPFQDGNGRLSRILATLLLLRAGYSYVLYSSLESVIEQSKESYYVALRQTQATIETGVPDWEPWLLFFLRALQQQMKRLARKVERERIFLAAMPELSLKIVEHAREHGRLTIGEMALLTDASRNTLKQHFRRLAGKGHLVLHGSGRGAWYGLGSL